LEGHIALQFFIAREPNNPHPPAAQNARQCIAPENRLPAGKIAQCRVQRSARGFTFHAMRVTRLSLRIKRKVSCAAVEARSTWLRRWSADCEACVVFTR